MLFVGGIANKEGRGIKILFGILIFILSNIIMFNPVSAALSIIFWIGILLLLAGIGYIIFAFQVRSLK
jgi:uncharacterized membrane protein HdeD (DUF308 family)